MWSREGKSLVRAGEAEGEQGRGLAAVRRRELRATVVASIVIRGTSHQLATPFTSSLKEI